MNKNNKYLIILLLTILTFVAFSGVATNDFINYDDDHYITKNPHIKNGISLETIKWALTTTYFSYWHPLTWLSHTLDWSLFGSWAGGHHLMSLFFHIGAVLFLFLFLNKTTQAIWPSAIVAALFAVHPLRVESVAWAAERKDVLSMFFGMAALYAYAFYARDKKISRYLLCLFLFVLALMSKPMLVTLPFILLLVDYWPLQRWQKTINPQDVKTQVAVVQRLKSKKKKKRENSAISAEKPKSPVTAQSAKQLTIELLKEKIPFFVLAFISCLITVWAQNKGGSIAPLEKLLFSDRLANALVSYVAYLGKIFWPVDLAVFYPYQLISAGQALGAAFFLIVLTAAVLFFIRKAPFLLVGWFWYLGSLVPVIGLVQVGNQAMADRYTYLPSIGIFMMLVWGSLYLMPRESIRKFILIPAATVIVVVLSYLTWQQCGYWKDSSSLFSHAIKIDPDNYLAHINLGETLHKKGLFNDALSHYRLALNNKPDSYTAYYNIGLVLDATGNTADAYKYYQKAIKLNPKYADAIYNTALILKNDGKIEEAADHFLRIIEINPYYTDAYNNLGIIYEMYFKNIDQGMYYYREALRVDNTNPAVHYNLGIALAQKGFTDDAIFHFRRAIELKPDFEAARHALDIALSMNQQK